MSVCSLGYIRVAATDLGKWRTFASDALGLMTADGPHGSLWLRTDDRPFRIAVEPSDRDGFIAAGWELRDAAAFADCTERLAASGVAVTHGTAADAESRQVNAVAYCSDPAGNRLELYYGRVRNYEPFMSPQGVTGFVTGDLGMGHVVLPAPQLDQTHDFYRDMLGFGDSDEMRLVMSPDPAVPPLRILFMHCESRRHHSLALLPMPVPSGLVHTMVEVRTLDDVGRALDRCLAAGHHISSSLGRHSNDGMVSFYVATPGGFDIEYGCDGITPDWSTWVPTRSLVDSTWGHKWAFRG